MFHEQGRGRAVVLLHSSMSSKNQWRALEHELRARYRVISIDLLGYGEVWAAAGTWNDVFPVEPEVLVRATDATVADIRRA